jgi:hypothetical protein
VEHLPKKKEKKKKKKGKGKEVDLRWKLGYERGCSAGGSVGFGGGNYGWCRLL